MYRRIFRWYSKAFSTPLHEVDALPLDDVLLAYWEERFEEMEDKDLEEIRGDVTEEPEELRQRQLDEDLAEVDIFEMSQEEITAAVKKASQTLVDSVAGLKQKMSDANPLSDRGAPELVPRNALPTLPPDIHMTFLSDDEDMDDGDFDTLGILNEPKRKPPK
jgi:hypothetical protein